MSSVVRAMKMGHAIQTSKGCASTLPTMRIELLLGQHIATTLE